MKNIAIIYVSESAQPLARTLQDALAGDATVGVFRRNALKGQWDGLDAVVFIGALGICVRSIAPLLKDKYSDPAVVCLDSTGKFVIPVVSGHVGGANDLARSIAGIIGGEAVVTTQSDNEGLWALDTLARQYGWQTEAGPAQMNRAVFAFVEKRPTALLLEVRDAGTGWLEMTRPEHVQVFQKL